MVHCRIPYKYIIIKKQLLSHGTRLATPSLKSTLNKV